MALSKRSNKDTLLSALKNLGKEEFKSLKKYLNDYELLSRYGLTAIPVSELEDKDRLDITDLLIRRYTMEEAWKVAALCLDAAGATEVARNLKRHFETMNFESEAMETVSSFR